MKYIADLHIHSAFSRATSKASNLQGLAAWAAIKGINVIGTGDFTHPEWYTHLCEQLVEDEPGMYRLRDEYLDCDSFLPPELQGMKTVEQVRFVLTAEISSIYKKAGRVRKNHNILFAPDLESVSRINRKLATIGNIHSDGRPILGLDAKDLLDIMLELAPEGFLVPAHIWTPWFSLFGSKSGFDTIEECFEELTPHIFALETGLSSDPEMNRCISSLDRFTLISNSDCHSPAKLGREANIFNTELSFYHMRDAIRKPRNAEEKQVFEATIEFYPEEGKYHCDGHRKCQICYEPEESIKHDNLCPVCNKPLTIGVLNRVVELADRTSPQYQPYDPAVYSITPLAEVLSELLNVGPASKKVSQAYARAIGTFGSEFSILIDVPLEEIGAKSNALFQEAIRRIRENEVIRKPGYDGEFGVIRVFEQDEKEQFIGQGNLFGMAASPPGKKKRKVTPQPKKKVDNTACTAVPRELNPQQKTAVDAESPIIAVQAGPGTGKTHTLVARVQKHLDEQDSPCTVITFTNKAADELHDRLSAQFEEGNGKEKLHVSTFHGYCLRWLRKNDPSLTVLGGNDRPFMLMRLEPDLSLQQAKEKAVVLVQLLGDPDGRNSVEVQIYRDALQQKHIIDIDLIIPGLIEILQENTPQSLQIRAETGALFVDEFQDINQEQYQLVSLLATSSPVFVIGDPDQSIYGFRGADVQWFSRFVETFHAQVIQLIHNYRSGLHIIKCAEELISRNTIHQERKPMLAVSKSSGSIYVQQCTTPEQEARFILDHIEAHLGGTSHRVIEGLNISDNGDYGLQDIAVLFRTSRQMESLSNVLNQRGIPYQRVDQKAFYAQNEMRPLFYAILLLAGKAQLEHQLFLIRQEKGVGEGAVRTISKWMGRVDQLPDILGEQIHGLFSSSTPSLLLAFQSFFHKIKKACAEGMPMANLVEQLAEHYGFEIQQHSVQQLRQLAVNYGPNIDSFATYLLRYSDSVLYDEMSDVITLSTLHAAKGLEFPVVFVAGFEEQLIPLQPRTELSLPAMQAHIEEERRLAYVGLTRAVETLYLTWCTTRVHNGQKCISQVSQFYSELPEEYLESPPVVRTAQKKQRTYKQLSLFS
ncbi:UvrD-helicase domain-containing protein [Desulfogranum japonicum]|uniref:UvrD-helicase domain-containing protein n=1 Tax=Desulfogranum japonicum TaxID=231447 RepID=UPI0003FE38D0|nr:UvrD-helicase domain-containing protein [Desulfogranum japonicum]